MIIQVFSSSMIFPCMELFLLVFQVFHDFQSLWEPWDSWEYQSRIQHSLWLDQDPKCLILQPTSYFFTLHLIRSIRYILFI